MNKQSKQILFKRKQYKRMNSDEYQSEMLFLFHCFDKNTLKHKIQFSF